MEGSKTVKHQKDTPQPVSEIQATEEPRVRCDGVCGGFIAEDYVDESAYTTADGRKGHVCSEPCAIKYEEGFTAEPPADVNDEVEPESAMGLNVPEPNPADYPKWNAKAA